MGGLRLQAGSCCRGRQPLLPPATLGFKTLKLPLSFPIQPLPAQGLVWCLFFNFIGGSALLISDGSQVAAWLWSAIWFVGGVPGAYILWYSRLYNAAIKDSAFGYAIFFAGFFANLVFSIWSAVGACLPASRGRCCAVLARHLLSGALLLLPVLQLAHPTSVSWLPMSPSPLSDTSHPAPPLTLQPLPLPPRSRTLASSRPPPASETTLGWVSSTSLAPPSGPWRACGACGCTSWCTAASAGRA